jgi:hypothetical protein
VFPATICNEATTQPFGVRKDRLDCPGKVAISIPLPELLRFRSEPGAGFQEFLRAERHSTVRFPPSCQKFTDIALRDAIPSGASDIDGVRFKRLARPKQVLGCQHSSDKIPT